MCLAPKVVEVVFIGNGLNDVSFTAGQSRGSFAPISALDQLPPQDLDQSWSYYNYIGGGQSGIVFPTSVKNPNKAIVTIDAKSSEVKYKMVFVELHTLILS